MAISGRLLADVRIFPSGCSGLLEVDRIEARGVEGRTELQLPGCTAPLLPDRFQGLAAALPIPMVAFLWTLPLQLLHFGAMTLVALVANHLVAPLLAPLTLLAMVSAVGSRRA